MFQVSSPDPRVQDILITLKYFFPKSVLICSGMDFVEVKQADRTLSRTPSHPQI